MKSLLRTLRREEATKILREFFSEHSSCIYCVSLIASENSSEGYRLQIGATLDKESRVCLRMSLRVNGYVMKESRGFILIDKKSLNQPAHLIM